MRIFVRIFVSLCWAPDPLSTTGNNPKSNDSLTDVLTQAETGICQAAGRRGGPTTPDGPFDTASCEPRLASRWTDGRTDGGQIIAVNG